MLYEHRGRRPRVDPTAYVAPSAVVVGDVTIGAGASLFPGSRVGAGSEVRINGVVQVNTVLSAGSLVPIGWVAVGSPAAILPPEQHEAIWAVQRELDFPMTVYGVSRDLPMTELMRRQSDFYGAHSEDRLIDE